MTIEQKEKMTLIIANQLKKLTSKGLSIDKSMTIIFESLNEKYPVALAAYNAR